MVHKKSDKKKSSLTLDNIDKSANILGWNVLGEKENRKYIKPDTEIRFFTGKNMYKTIVYYNGKRKNIDTTSDKKEALMFLYEMVGMW